MEKNQNALAIVPGSFDPMTKGHLFLVKEALKTYQKVVVAVMNNAEKTYFFSMEERVEIAKKTVENLKNVEVIGDSGLLIDLYAKLGANAVVKGYRNLQDLEYEKQMAEWNQAHLPSFNTILIPCQNGLENLSSTEVRSAIKSGKDYSQMMENSAYQLAKEIVKSK